MWCMETGTCLYTLAIEETPVPDDVMGNGSHRGIGGGGTTTTMMMDAGVTSVVLSPDGMYLAAASLDTIVRIWDARSGKLLDRLKGHRDSVYSVAFSPDGKFLVSGSLDKSLKMWDIEGLRKTLALEMMVAGGGGGGERITKIKIEKDREGDDEMGEVPEERNSIDKDELGEGSKTICTATLNGHKVSSLFFFGGADCLDWGRKS